jgi:hypothetical protein
MSIHDVPPSLDKADYCRQFARLIVDPEMPQAIPNPQAPSEQHGATAALSSRTAAIPLHRLRRGRCPSRTSPIASQSIQFSRRPVSSLVFQLLPCNKNTDKNRIRQEIFLLTGTINVRIVIDMENTAQFTDGVTGGTDARQQRGIEIAKIACITRNGNKYLVPSMSGNGRYEVDPVAVTCTCPDCQKGNICKHIYAAEVVMQRKWTRNADGSTTVTESVAISATKRTTYPQNWPAYNDHRVLR